MSAVLFDFFGTLAAYQPDRAVLAYPRSHALLERWGHHLSHEEFVATWHQCSSDLEATTSESLVELSMLEYAAAFGRSCATPLDPDEVQQLAVTFGAEWRDHVQQIPGSNALLKSLGARCRLGVVSNTSEVAMVPDLLSAYFPEVAFDPVVLSVDHGLRKPHPSIYECALRGLGCTPEEVVFVGDSYEADYLGPRSLGMRALLIDPLRRHPVDEVDRLETLLDLEERLSLGVPADAESETQSRQHEISGPADGVPNRRTGSPACGRHGATERRPACGDATDRGDRPGLTPSDSWCASPLQIRHSVRPSPIEIDRSVRFNVAVLLDADLDRWAVEAVASTGVPGLSVAVCDANGLAVGVGGVLSVETGDTVTADSIFQIGSTMKVATATAVMQLVETTTVSLDDPVTAHLPGLVVGDADLGGVTIRHLLDHTSGLPGNYFADFGRGDDSLDGYVQALATQEIVHPPGAMFSYSNSGYVIAGRLLEMRYDQPFRDLISDRVFSPLGLSSTTTRIEDVYGRRVAAGHEPVAGGQHRVCPDQVVGWSSVPAGSQAMSTAGELATFARLAMNPTGDAAGVLSSASAAAMARASVDLPCPYWGRSSQGLGWGVDHRKARSILSHGGGTTGHSALMLAVPDLGVSIVVLANTVAGAVLNAPIDDLVADVTGLGPARSAPDASVDPVGVDEEPSWIGTYADAWMIHRVEPDQDGALLLQREVLPNPLTPAGSLPPALLYRVDEQTAVAGGGRPIAFLSDTEAKDQALYLHQVSAARRRV